MQQPVPLARSNSGDLGGGGAVPILSPLAKKIAAARKGGSTATYRQREVNGNCLIRCVDWLSKNEEHAAHVWHLIISGGLGLSCQADMAEFLEVAPKAMGKIDITWRAQFVVDYSDGRLSSQLVQGLLM